MTPTMQAILALAVMVGALIGVTAYLWNRVSALEAVEETKKSKAQEDHHWKKCQADAQRIGEDRRLREWKAAFRKLAKELDR